MCEQYLLSYYKEAIIDILKAPDETKHFSVNIDFVEMSGTDPTLVNNFLKEPEKSLGEWDNALKRAQTQLILNSEEEYLAKDNVHCRFYSLPMLPELHTTKFPQISDVNKFLQISGTVVRMTAMKLLEHQRQYICTKCKFTMLVKADYEFKNIIIPPKRCTNPEECKGTNIISLGDLQTEFCKDYQEIKMQETLSTLDVGCIPNSMWVTLEDDLVDSCKPGDNITVCGLVKKRSNQLFIGKKIDIELVIKANHVEVNNDSSALSVTPELKDMFESFWKTYSDTPLAARDIILKSICPQLFGLFVVKLATAVALAGGSNAHSNTNTGVKVRSEPHLLLVGDPGTGKSQLLKFAAKIIPRSVLTTGVGSTAAGLTVAAVMENGEWQLEGGALVMSDGGICCIDEFNTMKEHDRLSIHEAMEQQTISVAKASIVCKLSTRCSILAATNPKGNLDPSQPLAMNIALASPLLSRFDLILLMKDKVDEKYDSELVDYIFNSLENSNSSKLSENINWTVETLQAYFAIIKKIHPMLTEDSNTILSAYYQAQRRKNYRNKSRTTVRLLDSLVRLSQGHARLMYHKEVQILDAVMALVLVELAMEADFSVFDLRFDLRNDFPTDPEGNYRELVEIILKKLELEDLLQKELEKLEKTGKKVNLGDKEKFLPLFKKESPFFLVKNGENGKIIQTKHEGKENGENFIKKSDKKSNFLERNEAGPSGINKQAIKNKEGKKEEENIKNQLRVEKDEAGPSGIKLIKECEEMENKETCNKNKMEDDGKNDTLIKNDKNKKRVKSGNKIKCKKVRLNETEVKNDLVALNSIPSVNDIFAGMDCDLNFDDSEMDVDDGEKENGETENKGERNRQTEIVDIKQKSAEREPERNKDKDKKESNGTNEVLTQRSRTKKFLSKFRFVPKVDNQIEDKEESEKNGHFDISFNNIHCSTQREKNVVNNDKKDCIMKSDVAEKNPFEDDISLGNTELDKNMIINKQKKDVPKNINTGERNMFENDDFNMSLNLNADKNLTGKDGPKKFNFKKITNTDSAKTTIAPCSIFESQEEVDFDL